MAAAAYVQAAKQAVLDAARVAQAYVPAHPVLAAATYAAAAVAVYLIAIGLLQLKHTVRVRAYIRQVPKPRGWLPFVGHALALATGAESPWEHMHSWNKQLGGGACHFTVLGQEVIYVRSRALCKRVLQTNQRNYRKDKPSYKHFLCLLGTGLVTSEDEKWRKGRMLLSHTMRIEALAGIPAISHAALEQLMAKGRDGGMLDLSEEFRHLTLQVIGQAVLSLTAEEADRVFPDLYLPIVTECNARVWAPWRQFMPWLQGCREQSRQLGALNAYILRLVNRRWETRQTEAAAEKATGKPPARKQDILDRYMSQLKTFGTTEQHQLRDDIKTMILAGHETSASALTFAVYELLAHPQYIPYVRAEYHDVFGSTARKGGAALTMEDGKKLKWALAVLREGLRKHSPVPLTMRVAAADDVIPKADSGLAYDLTIPKDCAVMVGINGAHHYEDNWDAPSAFRPERMLDFDAVDQWAFLPFINGPRNCLGQHLSLLETSTVLSHLIGLMDVALAKGDVATVGDHQRATIPQIPHDGLWVTMAPAPASAAAAAANAVAAGKGKPLARGRSATPKKKAAGGRRSVTPRRR